MSEYKVTVIVTKDEHIVGSVTLSGASPLLLLNAAAGATHHALLAHPETGQPPTQKES